MPGIWKEIEDRIRAGYTYFYLTTHEENRVTANLRQVAKKLECPLVTWSAYDGFKPEFPGIEGAPLEIIAASEGQGLFFLRDFHHQMNELSTIRQLKDLRERLISCGKAVIVSAPVLSLPRELEKIFAVIDVPFPEMNELLVLFNGLCKQRGIDCPLETAELFARSACGLTAEEAMLVFSRVTLTPDIVDSGDTAIVVDEKRRLVESAGVLQFYDRDVSLNDVGGLHSLKDWLKEREAAFEQKARSFGLPEPRGLMLLGVQGCGKSLTAKAVAAHWRLPLVQLDLVAAFSGHGSPEEAIRNGLKLLEAMSPVVVWIDEIEKGFAGTKQMGGEVSIHRIFGHFITWLQEKRAPVFVVATANSVDELPPELLRKGRFDELFFVDLPDEHERLEILELHLKKRNADTENLELDKLVAITRNFTGSELEQVIVDALYRAFAGKHRFGAEDLETVAQTLVPIYNTYEEDIKRLRDWAKERTRRASVDTTLTDYFEKEGGP